MALTLMSAWDQFVAERSISLSATSLTSDYRQARNWLSRCPHQNFETEGRLILTWVLQQQPVQSARRVAMYLKALYRWASGALSLEARELIVAQSADFAAYRQRAQGNEITRRRRIGLDVDFSRRAITAAGRNHKPGPAFTLDLDPEAGQQVECDLDIGF